MNWGRVLAVTNIVISTAACVGYLVNKDYRRALYWGSAAVLTSSMTF